VRADQLPVVPALAADVTNSASLSKSEASASASRSFHGPGEQVGMPHALLEGGHVPSDRLTLMREVLEWLDRWLGPVGESSPGPAP
jgi:hypothetical protein